MSFEEYVSIPDTHVKSFINVVGQFGVFKYVETVISDTRTKFEGRPKEEYTFIVWNCKHLYKIYGKEYPDIEALMLGLYKLDNDCGDTLPIFEDLSREELSERLHIIDLDREKFKVIFLENYHKIKETSALFVEFARLIFQFNGYQAPYRTDPQKASEDAMGLTDLFGEFLEEINVK